MVQLYNQATIMIILSEKILNEELNDGKQNLYSPVTPGYFQNHVWKERGIFVCGITVYPGANNE